MSLLDEARSMGMVLRIIPQTGAIGVSPKDKVTAEQKQWVVDNKAALISELSERSEKVGTTLRSVITWLVLPWLLAKVPEETCNCKAVETQMNQRGLDVCCQERKKIIEHLYFQSSGMTLVPRLLRLIGAAMLLEIAITIEKGRRRGLW